LAAEILIRSRQWSWDDPVPLDQREVWYRCDFEANGSHYIEFHGLATIADIFLDGEQIASSHNMFVPLSCNVNLSIKHRLEIRFRPLTPYLENKSGARWRPRMIQPSGLRNVRTTALGRMPGFAPPAPPVGPWRDIELVSHGKVRVLRADLKPRLEDATGILDVTIETQGAQNSEATLTCAGETTTLRQTRADVYEGTLRTPNVAPWWPHTHGEPHLHQVAAQIGLTKIDLGRTGFRRIEIDRGPDGRGFGLVINGEPIFCRGAVWTAADPIGLNSSRERLLPLLQQARDAGMNMLRVGGTLFTRATLSSIYATNSESLSGTIFSSPISSIRSAIRISAILSSRKHAPSRPHASLAHPRDPLRRQRSFSAGRDDGSVGEELALASVRRDSSRHRA
jgi:beta-mannosidase